MDEKEEELDKRRPERGVVQYLLSSLISVICQLIPPVLCPLRPHADDDQGISKKNWYFLGIRGGGPELQKRADRADQSVLFFLAGANFWEKHAKNC